MILAGRTIKNQEWFGRIAYKIALQDCHFDPGDFNGLKFAIQSTGQLGRWRTSENKRFFAPADGHRYLAWRADTGDLVVGMSGQYLRTLPDDSLDSASHREAAIEIVERLRQEKRRRRVYVEEVLADRHMGNVLKDYLVKHFRMKGTQAMTELVAKAASIRVPGAESGPQQVLHVFTRTGEYRGFRLIPPMGLDLNHDWPDSNISVPRRGWLVRDNILDLTVPLRISLEEYSPVRDIDDVVSNLDQALLSLRRLVRKNNPNTTAGASWRAFFADRNNFDAESVAYFTEVMTGSWRKSTQASA
ncbi:MAG TPA: hypothetical protein VGL97_16935 [Bryobacteraceae bacterium]|jgi:hypothetical protein